MTQKAIEKIKTQLNEPIKGESKHIQVVKKPVVDALISFCEQQEEFAEAVVQSEKHLHECLAFVVKDVRSALSDIEAYRRAVQFYFPGAVVDMVLTLRMSEFEEKKTSKTSDSGTKGEMNFSLMDLLEV